MGIFDSILERLGMKKDEPEAESPKPAGASGSKKVGSAKQEVRRRVEARESAASTVDVESIMEAKAKEAGQELNWKESIVDLLKLLGIDSSFEARQALAKELNADEDTMADSARMNIWLHKEVMRRVAKNGGKVPKELLD